MNVTRAGLLALIGALFVAALAVPAAPAGGSVAPADEEPSALRLLSSPDFLNADVADLGRGHNFWKRGRTENGINRAYRHALDAILDDWVSKRPDGVLVAGDLVNGRWGKDTANTGIFGPVRTLEQRKAAVRLAADTYYPQWLERFAEHGLDVYPAVGDHEYGDNDWSQEKRDLASTFADAFADHITTTASGEPRFADRPRGPHRRTAYAWRPRPDVQVVSIDVFDITEKSAHLRVDRAQLRWLREVLTKAREDGVTWTVVQGHTPIVGPVRARGSSRLRYERGSRSALWRTFQELGVDVYLCGEVHAITATTRDGILQLAHGGAFQFGLTTYATLDFYADRLEIDLLDYKLDLKDAKNGSRLWETAQEGLMKIVELDSRPNLVGEVTLGSNGEILQRTGVLLPYDPARKARRTAAKR